MCFVVTCWERADLLALVCGVFCEFVTFPLVLGQVWYLIVSIPDLCNLITLADRIISMIVKQLVYLIQAVKERHNINE